MTPQELEHGEIMTLALHPAGGGLFDRPPAKGEEVRLRLGSNHEDAFLVADGRAIAVEGHDDATVRRLQSVRELDPPRVTWVGDHSTRDGTGVLTVLLHRFRTRYRWDELVLAVDERIVDRVVKLAGRPLEVGDVCAWLQERIVMPAEADLPRVIATGAPDDGGRFRLLGRGIAVDVSPGQEMLLVERVVRLRQDRQGFRPPEMLIEVALRFEDATSAGKARQSVRAQLDRLVAESRSYIALWKSYQNIEREQLFRTARELGWVGYSSYEALASGLWAFRITSHKELEQLEQRASDEVELQAGNKVPPELLDPAAASEPEIRDRPFVGSLERIRLDRDVIELRPLDEDADTVPPKKGYLFAALQGDRKRLERREEAIRRLLSADAKISDLSMILEGGPARPRRIDEVAAMSPAARRVFGSDPTAAQRDAIDKALNTPDIALIQGPPGTGKTTVIAAIQVRLAELEAEQEELSGRTLLTSYQHDAVDNAVERSSVLGLPPARFGGRHGSHAVDDQAARWSTETHERLQAKLSSLGEERPRAQYRHFRDRVAAYASGKLQALDAKSILDDLLALETEVLPTELWDRLRALGRRVASKSGVPGDLERVLNEKAARGLAPQNTAFIDGGATQARRALRQLEPLLSDTEKALLTRASEVPPGEVFAEIEELAALRSALLDRLDREAIPGDRGGLDPEVMDVLNAAITGLHARMAASRGGIADALEEYAETLRLAPGDVIRTLRHYSAVYAATCQQAVGHAIADARGARSDLWFENVVVDEAARANPLDLFIPMSLGKRRIILVGDHRQLPHLLEPKVEHELSENVTVETARALKTSLFERLFNDLRARELRGERQRVVTLNQQFRMHPVLGTFVSDIFYAPFGEGFDSPRPAADFSHELSNWMKDGQPVCAAWKRLPRAEGQERRNGTSWERRVEAEWIAEACRSMIDGAGHALTIGVISFYKPQVALVLRAMQAEGLAEPDPDSGQLEVARAYRTLERRGKQEQRLRVGTVDSFQGMEFDIVFLSVVRCNTVQGKDDTTRRKKYGHLLLPNRLCVAMSRQKRLLIAVGDHEMFIGEQASEAVPGLHAFLDLCGGPHGLVA
jgi:hypothetical protein